MSTRRLGVQRARLARLGGGYAAQVLADQPLGYWRLDEVAGTTALDASGNGRNGTVVGTNILLNQVGAITNTDPGARAYKWTGAGTHILIPHGAWMNVTNAASWEWWLNPGVNENNAGIFSRFQNGGGGAASWIHWYNAAVVNFRVQIGGNPRSVAINPPQLGVWTQLVATFDGANLRGYVNGALIGTTPAAGSIDTGAGDMSVGSYQAGTWNLSNHLVDEVSFMATCLSPERVMARYNAGVGIR